MLAHEGQQARFATATDASDNLDRFTILKALQLAQVDISGKELVMDGEHMGSCVGLDKEKKQGR